MLHLLQLVAESNNPSELAESNKPSEMDDQSLASPVLCPLSQADKVNEM